jgi:hypothetical protein
MNVYAFYEPLDYYAYVHEDQKKLIELWKKSWSYYGWNPIVYGIKECQESEDFKAVYHSCENLPTINYKKYELYCFLRWLYMSKVGGWYADLDMINYGFTPLECNGKTATASLGLQCSCFHMSTDGYKAVIETLKNLKESDSKYNAMVNGKKHFSDMYVLSNFKDIKIKLNIQKEFMSIGYKNAKIVHYHFGMYNNPNCVGRTRTQVILEDPRTKAFL